MQTFVDYAFNLLSVVYTDGWEQLVSDMRSFYLIQSYLGPDSLFESAGSTVRLADSLAEMARFPFTDPDSSDVVEGEVSFGLVQKFLIEWATVPVSEYQAAFDMIVYQIHKSICPNIFGVIDSIDWRFNLLRFPSSLCAICAGVASLDTLLPTSRALGQYSTPETSHGTPVVISNERHVEAAATALRHRDITWTLHYDIHIQDRASFLESVLVELNPLVDVGSFNRFRIASEFPSRDEFESTMLAFGRLMGTFIRSELKLGTAVGLPFEFYGYLRDTRIPFGLILNAFDGIDTRGITDPHEVLFSFIAEPAFFIRIGIRDILGPVGTDIFTERQWINIFRRVSTRAPRSSILVTP